MIKKIDIGARVTISTHGSMPGTVQKIVGDRIVVQIDTEPAPRLCLAINVFLLD